MLGKNQKIKPEDAETIIGAGVKVDGTFTAFGNVIVKGQLLGSLKTESDVSIKEGGSVDADIKAKNASIAGKVDGNLEVNQKIQLANSAKVTGDINCQVLSIEEGAILQGNCKVGGEKNATPEPEVETEE
ncbi:MAG TPA: polymer-forming cytoskeletal protein [Patescibacteria group bacterium]|nr:polymer-forming cytoskeletal protein [Patescibacteria group bacterium]